MDLRLEKLQAFLQLENNYPLTSAVVLKLKLQSYDLSVNWDEPTCFDIFLLQSIQTLHWCEYSINLVKNKQIRKSSILFPEQYCPYTTYVNCASKSNSQCSLMHFVPVMEHHTEPKLGDCKYLDLCHRRGKCKYVHYERESVIVTDVHIGRGICCDLTTYELASLGGDFEIVLVDPPWTIQQKVPYDTWSDEAILNLKVEALSSKLKAGWCFLWITDRARKIGHQCLRKWGYEFIVDMVWVKWNQLGHLAGTSGKTGHWLNHSKEHCLVGRKGQFPDGLVLSDCIGGFVRETSQKPDEFYTVFESMSTGGKKIELFGRQNNLRNGWLTLGNQLENTQ